MFSQACVKNSVRGGRAWQGGMCGRGCVHGMEACVAGETATAAGGMHPTGMHSCFLCGYTEDTFLYLEN